MIEKPMPGELLYLRPVGTSSIIVYNVDGVKEAIPDVKVTKACTVVSSAERGVFGTHEWRCWVLVEGRLLCVWAGNLHRAIEVESDFWSSRRISYEPVIPINVGIRRHRKHGR